MAYQRFIALCLPIESLPALGLDGSHDADTIIFGKLRCLLPDEPKANQPRKIHPAVINRPESHNGPNRGKAVGRDFIYADSLPEDAYLIAAFQLTGSDILFSCQ